MMAARKQAGDGALHLLTGYQITISFSQRRTQKWPSSISSAFQLTQPARPCGRCTSNSSAAMPAGRSSARQAGPQGSRSRRWNPGRCSPATRRVGVHVRKKRIPFPGETRIKKGEKGKAGTGEWGIRQMFVHEGRRERPPPPVPRGDRHPVSICRTKSRGHSLGPWGRWGRAQHSREAATAQAPVTPTQAMQTQIAVPRHAWPGFSLSWGKCHGFLAP
jgi:hypothetical protein